MTHRRLVAGLAASALIPMAAAVVSAPSQAAPTLPRAAEEPPPAARLWAPSLVEGELYGNRERASVQLPVRLVAGSAPIEVWSTRAGYDVGISTTVRTSSGEVQLPLGTVEQLGKIAKFARVTAVDVKTGKVVLAQNKAACLNGYGQRVRPDAPARSPFPRSCYANPYSLGSVQAVQTGWSNTFLGQYGGTSVRLPRGRFDVTVRVKQVWADALGLVGDEASRTIRIRVSHDHADHDHGGEPVPGTLPERSGSPAAHRPTGPEQRRVSGPQPNLRSLPAWGISLSENGQQMRFSATVWNAGDSPLVVDGFVDETKKDTMDAYQYFFDADGEQTGYQQVGSFEFDHKETHQHWHFRDFATYTLLRADKSTAVVSRKEAFCLANTDAVDLTVPSAEWQPENTDLSTDCGYEDSLSLREVLAAGWGDTYAQFRAGQSFKISDLPNGKYFIATIANPENRLVEGQYDDNVALRKVYISGKGENRKVRVPQVGLVVEPEQQFFD